MGISIISNSNDINNISTEEFKEVGNSLVRYISKPIELSDGQDAEDLNVYLTSYKPFGTDIKVYARIHNAEDAEAFTDKDYTPLKQIPASILILIVLILLTLKNLNMGLVRIQMVKGS